MIAVTLISDLTLLRFELMELEQRSALNDLQCLHRSVPISRIEQQAGSWPWRYIERCATGPICTHVHAYTYTLGRNWYGSLIYIIADSTVCLIVYVLEW